jgi:hypothetical protein
MQRFTNFLLEDLLWFLEMTTNPHILVHINTESLVDMYLKLKTNIIIIIIIIIMFMED